MHISFELLLRNHVNEQVKLQDNKSSIESNSLEQKFEKNRVQTLLQYLADPVFAMNLDNQVEYVNPAFENIFGWTLQEVQGKNIKFIPDHLMEQAKQGMGKLFENKVVREFETQRYTKDGRILDIVINGSLLYDENNAPTGQVLILRDMTAEKRTAKSNQVMFRISKALHSSYNLSDLIALITKEIKDLIAVEGAFILLADEKKNQLYFFTAEYKDSESEKMFKKIRFSADLGVSGKVYQTGEPVIIPDVTKCSYFLRRVDDETDLVTRNILTVPIKVKDKTIGVVAVVNKNHGDFDTTDIDVLSVVTSAIGLPIENTRIHDELRRSYQELKTLNRAKDKVINHLAHELKTPVSVLNASMTLFSKKLTRLGIEDQSIKRIVTRGQRNLSRLLEIQYEVEDLLRKKDYTAYRLLSKLLESCKDELMVLVESQLVESQLVESETRDTTILKNVQQTIETVFGPKEVKSESLMLDKTLIREIEGMRPKFIHRELVLNTQIESSIPVLIAPDPLSIILNGLIRNAFEYTPDNGKINISLKTNDKGSELIIKDHGIGITEEKLHLIIENYFTPPESLEYSTKMPFEFNAGGRGFDLMRIKIFSERFNFKFSIKSVRCHVIPKESDICPGNVDLCKSCSSVKDCHSSGGTEISLIFRSANN